MFLKKLNVKEVEQIKHEINRFIARQAIKLKLCPYAAETLHELHKKHKIALITNSARPFVLAFLAHYKLKSCFDKILTAEDFTIKEQGFKKLFKKFKVKPAETLYIADKQSDVAIARKVGCSIAIALACSWDKDKFGHERFVFRNLRELSKIL
jgi:HAD superfamily hydrolase (TIGR01509 family)